jgi:hypothetical protein
MVARRLHTSHEPGPGTGIRTWGRSTTSPSQRHVRTPVGHGLTGCAELSEFRCQLSADLEAYS